MKINNFNVIKTINGYVVATDGGIAVFHKRKFALQAVGRFLKSGKLLNRPAKEVA